MTDTQIWQLIGGGGFLTGATSIVVAWINRHRAPIDVEKVKADVEKTRAETQKAKNEMENFVVSTLKTALDEMRMEREDDRKQIRENKEEASLAKAQAKAAIEQNEDCEFEHGITRLQLNKVLRKLEMERWIKSSVFVLDDNKMVTDIFTHRFRTIPVVNFKCYTDWRLFLADVQRERPEIVVMDDGLTMETDNSEVTAQMVIMQFGYTPEILVMSGTKENELKYKDTDVKFFYKDRWYVRNITKTILEHLEAKNQKNYDNK